MEVSFQCKMELRATCNAADGPVEHDDDEVDVVVVFVVVAAAVTKFRGVTKNDRFVG